MELCGCCARTELTMDVCRRMRNGEIVYTGDIGSNPCVQYAEQEPCDVTGASAKSFVGSDTQVNDI